MDQRSATIDDVGDVTVAFGSAGADQRHCHAREHLGGIVLDELACADAVVAHSADTMRDDQPWSCQTKTAVGAGRW